MPSRALRTGCPTFYLDTSTLSDAFRAHVGDADPEYAPLLPWLERVAAEANLCFSLTHLLELSRWRDDTAGVIVKWLDEQPLVWVRGMAAVQDEEDEYWLRVALGEPPPEPVNAFAPSMLRALTGINVQTSPDALRAVRLPDMVDVYRSVDTRNVRGDVRRLLHVCNVSPCPVLT